MDFYILLGLGADASLGEIKRAYRGWRANIIPDINPGDRSRGGAVPADRRSLRDADRSGSAAALRRRRVDRRRCSKRARSASKDSISRSASAARRRRPSAICSRNLAAAERRRPSQQQPERGADLHLTITLPLRSGDARRPASGDGHPAGALRASAAASGTTAVGRARSAADCHGSGVVKSARGHMVFSQPCVPCRGTGRQPDARCRACGGQQREMRTETLTIQLPAGLADGARIRVPGKGHAGLNGGEHGRPAASTFASSRIRCSGATATISI